MSVGSPPLAKAQQQLQRGKLLHQMFNAMQGLRATTPPQKLLRQLLHQLQQLSMLLLTLLTQSAATTAQPLQALLVNLFPPPPSPHTQPCRVAHVSLSTAYVMWCHVCINNTRSKSVKDCSFLSFLHLFFSRCRLRSLSTSWPSCLWPKYLVMCTKQT